MISLKENGFLFINDVTRARASIVLVLELGLDRFGLDKIGEYTGIHSTLE